jgi:hypothetical protein
VDVLLAMGKKNSLMIVNNKRKSDLMKGTTLKQMYSRWTYIAVEEHCELEADPSHCA